MFFALLFFLPTMSATTKPSHVSSQQAPPRPRVHIAMNCATKSQKALPSIALATSTCKSSNFMCSSPLPLCSRRERLACASQPQDQDNGRCHFCSVTFCCHHLSPTLAASQSACQAVAERGNKLLGKDSLPLLLWVREKTKAREEADAHLLFI